MLKKKPNRLRRLDQDLLAATRAARSPKRSSNLWRNKKDMRSTKDRTIRRTRNLLLDNKTVAASLICWNKGTDTNNSKT